MATLNKTVGYENEDEHMDHNTQKHLALMPAATLSISKDFEQKLQEQQGMFEQKLQEQQEEFEKKVKQQMEEHEQKQKKNDERMQQVEQKLDTQNQEFKERLGGQQKEFQEMVKQIESLQSKIQEITPHVHSPPYYCTASNYQQARGGYTTSPPMYTHPGGYKFKLELYPNGDGAGTHVSVRVYSLKSDHDTELKVPVKFTIALQLLNQHRDQDHHTRDIQCEIKTRDKIGSGLYFIGYDWTFIPLADLEWNHDKQTQYLKDDCLKFRITKIVVR